MTNLSHPVPQFSTGDAEKLGEQLFNVIGTATPLDGERDRNYRLKTDTDAGWILKVVNASEPRVESEFQTALLSHLARHSPELSVPFLKRSLDGEFLASAVAPSGEQHAVRLVSWLQGTPLAEVPRTMPLMRSLGRAFGAVDRALQGFMHPGAVRDFDWDLRHAARSRSRLHFVKDLEKRAILERFIDSFEQNVQPQLARLRTQIIHNDGNDWNVLVDSEDQQKVSGIIDFGDAVHTVLIAEVAITCAYSILDMEDPIGAAAALAAGFHEQYPLQAEELDVLFNLIAMRLVTSVTLSASRHDRTEDNPYLAISEAPAWRLLEKMDRMNPRLATAILRKACGFDAIEGAGAIRRWVAQNSKSFADIVRPSAASMNKMIAPFGDASHVMTIASAEQRPGEATKWWEDFSAEHKVPLGIGPWGEARTIYTDTAFESRFIEGQRRIIHVGVDLIMPAGTPLYTPVAGVVQSVEVEREPLGYGGVIMLKHSPEGCPPFLTLWGHMAHEALDRLQPGDYLEAGALVGHMGADTENGGWIPHVHFQMSTDIGLQASVVQIDGLFDPITTNVAQLKAGVFLAAGRDMLVAAHLRHHGVELRLGESLEEVLCDDSGRVSGARTSVSSVTVTGEPPVSSMPATTACQSYVSSSKIPSARETGVVSHGHMHCAHREPAFRAPPVLSAISKARANGAHPSVCTACTFGLVAPAKKPLAAQVTNAPPPACTNIRLNNEPGRFSATTAISQPIVRPPSRHHAFSGPCTPKGIAPATIASRNLNTHGSPGGSVASLAQRTTFAFSALKILSVGASACSGTNT